MKTIALLALFLLVPTLLGSVSAEREFAQVGLFNISFEMNRTHDIKEIEDGIYIRTLDGNIVVDLGRDKSGTTNLDEFIKLTGAKHPSVETLQIDGKDARLATTIGGGYIALYYPLQGWIAIVASDLSMKEIPDFFKTLHIEPI